MESWHFCIANIGKLLGFRNQSLQYEFKAPRQIPICIETDSAVNYFQFISIRICTKMPTLPTFCITGKLRSGDVGVQFNELSFPVITQSWQCCHFCIVS